MLVSSSDGFWRDGLVAAILLRALMIVVVVGRKRASRFRENRGRNLEGLNVRAR